MVIPWLGNFAWVVRLPSGNRAERFLSGEPVPRQTSVGLLPVFEGDVPDVQLAVSQNGVPAAWIFMKLFLHLISSREFKIITFLKQWASILYTKYFVLLSFHTECQWMLKLYFLISSRQIVAKLLCPKLNYILGPVIQLFSKVILYSQSIRMIKLLFNIKTTNSRVVIVYKVKLYFWASGSAFLKGHLVPLN